MAGDGRNTVLVNGLSPVTSKSEGTVVGFADICQTPGPGGPVPIAYPNVARSGDLEDGSKRVSINGAPVCLSSSSLGTSTGNEAATAGGGVASGKTKGAAHPVNYSFGYHPDRRQNGVMLPMRVALACQLHVAVHRGNHAEGFAYDLHLPYPRAVMARLKKIATQLEQGTFCADPGALVRKLDALSAEILEKVARFTWTLTRDGLDYQEGGMGCAGVTRIPEKPEQRCPKQRRHRLTHAISGRPLAGRALKVGE